MNLVLWEDEKVNQLFPITTGRLAYAISCASYRLIDWIRQLNVPIYADARPHLRTIQELDFQDVAEVPTSSAQPTLIVNARTVPCKTSFETLQSIIKQMRFGTVHDGDAIAAALVPAEHPGLNFRQNESANARILRSEQFEDLPMLGSQLKLMNYPHDVIKYNLECFSENLNHRINNGNFREISDGVFGAEGADLGEFITNDTSEGPILIDENSKIGPYCFLSGPAYIGPNSRVIEHSAIKDAVSIGHTTKIGGEVEASVIEAYTNKQHHGFLGHSYLGSWINLGAGTCNSDLKNTYGKVRMEYGGEKVDTDMQFLGCIMGDYAKSAINSGIFTGKIIGTCSMVYGFVTTNVPSFVNYARIFGQVTELPPDVMAATQQRMFLRRKVQQRPCDIQLIHEMYNLTQQERRMAGQPLSL